VDPAGHRLDQLAVNTLVGELAPGGHAQEALRQRGYTLWESYQPNSRFWAFQAVEAAWLCALALALAAATFWWVRRRAG